MTQTTPIQSDAIPSNRSRRRIHPDAWLAIAALLAGIFMRWYRLGSASLWFDEGYTAWVVSLPIHKLIHAISADTAPPLHYLLLRGWTLLFGRTEAAMRAMSALCATLALLLFVPVAWRILLRDRRASAIAVILFSLGYLQVAYSHEARMYELMTLWMVAGLWAVLRAIDRPGVKSVLLVAVMWAGGLYTSNIMALYVAGMAIAWLVLPGVATIRQRVIQMVSAGVITAALFSPWVPTMLRQSQAIQGHFWMVRPDAWGLLRAIAVLGGINEQGIAPLSAHWLVGMTVLLVVCLGITLVVHRTRSIAFALLCMGIGPVLVLFFISRVGQPIFIERALLPSTVILPIMLALPAVLSWRSARIVLLMAMILAVLDVHSSHHHYQGEHAEHWRSACRYAAADLKPNDHIVFVANEGELLFDYYSRGSNYSPSKQLLGAPADFFALNPPRTLRRVLSNADLKSLRSAIADSPAGKWTLVESHSFWADPDHRVMALLNRHFHLIGQRQFTQVAVYRFSSS